MRFIAITIFDNKLKTFSPPFYFPTMVDVYRGLKDVCNDSSSKFFKHPGDFQFFKIGEFDDNEAKFFGLEDPLENLGVPSSFKDNNADVSKVE